MVNPPMVMGSSNFSSSACNSRLIPADPMAMFALPTGGGDCAPSSAAGSELFLDAKSSFPTSFSKEIGKEMPFRVCGSVPAGITKSWVLEHPTKKKQ
jgi:hypothetical protein